MKWLFWKLKSLTLVKEDLEEQARKSGRWLPFLQILWLVVTVLTIIHLVASFPLVAASGQSLGLTRGEHDIVILYVTALDIIMASVYLVVGILIFWHTAYERMALYTAFTLVTFGGTAFAKTDIFTTNVWVWGKTVTAIAFLGQVLFLSFFYLFPNGHFIPRWTRFLTVLLAFLLWIFYFFPDLSLSRWLSSTLFLWSASFILCCIFAQVYRYRRVSNAVQRQQSKWVAFGLIVTALSYLIYEGIQLLLLSFHIRSLLFIIVGQTCITACVICVPLSIGMAILRYRLWEIDQIINRTVVYGMLTASVVGLYVFVVGTLAWLFQASNNLFVSLLATGCVAVLVQPLRTRLQRSVNRFMYGERDDPYTTLSRLARRLEGTLSADAMLTTIVETIGQALKLPYVALSLKEEHGFVQVATYGTIKDENIEKLLHLPLIAQNEQVGELLLAPRTTGEVFIEAEQQVLRELARQAGLAVRTARLTTDLQRLTIDLQHSRERLVLAREEERRRIRRDLHDGLGPTLAALALNASMISELITINPAAATQMAHELQKEIRATVGDIRRLVYALRPPALDQLGLVAAIREHITHATPQSALTGEDGAPELTVTIQAPATLPPLPAAVEVAAYRIVQEAFTNVVRHAHASNCQLQLSLGNMLEIEISDDGQGIPVEHHMGVGLISMRERATELGGRCTIESNKDAGTRIYAQLPLLKEH